MTDFKIGDVVRFRDDSLTRLDVIVRALFTKVLRESDREAFCVSDCGQRIFWAKFDQLELVNRPDPQADLKQAIREVLLGDEFMKAFAAAFIKTPWPLSMQYDTRDGERIQSLADYPFGEPSELSEPKINNSILPEAKSARLDYAERTLKAIWQANDGGNQ